jgi:8-oxo-dGTP pyrophosphatase MutT (NUDIX family)
MLKAAGVLFRTGGRVLLLRRTEAGDQGGSWALPGGKVEKGEKIESAATRECFEETEYIIKEPMALFARRQADGVDYTTFQVRLEAPFAPDLNEEHDDYRWAEEGDYPSPLHPGVKIVLDKLQWNELDIARAIRDGQLTSPQYYENVALFAMRITGTGTAFRQGRDEYVYRPPDIYLNDEFLARCNGLAVIMEHPIGSKLTSSDFQERVVGSILLPYLQGDEVWGIAKIYDDTAMEMMAENQLSTSPAVLFDTSKPQDIREVDGRKLFIEDDPSLLDHLAICEVGVWDKGENPSGVTSVIAIDKDPKMAEIDDKKMMADKARKDAEEGDKFDKVMKGFDAMNSRFDAMATRMDSFDKMRKDAEFPAEGAKPADEGADGDIAKNKETVKTTPEAVADDDKMTDEDKKKWAADKMRKDEADESNKKLMAADAETTRKKIADMEGRMPKQLTDEEEEAAADAQARCDSVAQVFGRRAPRMLNGETLLAYRKRMAKDYKTHSQTWKDVDLASLPESAFAPIEKFIYADALNAGMNPASAPPGMLREIRRTDQTGRVISTFVGVPDAWLCEFKQQKMRARINANANKGA